MDYKECEILIIEDNPNDAELMVRSLKKNHLANNLIVIDDGQEALDYISSKGKYVNRNIQEPPKVIFLDLKLPKVDGLEVLKELKSNKTTKKIPVVVLTSSKEDPDITKAYELGANSYVVKPVDFEDFIKTLSQIGMYWIAVNEKPK